MKSSLERAINTIKTALKDGKPETADVRLNAQYVLDDICDLLHGAYDANPLQFVSDVEWNLMDGPEETKL